ncbi:MAG: tryptophan--tRNA ligase [Candidatus Sungbacteria bacterium RIFCSPLOWO2_12_FULL_41_11]|uniref:Tryptophan--tRNA ligase n=1 Tax=Candidatus Sungbacteria bacterium RIFCSPLOWO2_12_FULL_41_11 TaxID=1802286 RepID=A0A1G2LPS1_9BACT|nr:MAG: Tryptophan-tRNA ligase [Parcubacteria group bacterium GW2011_GWA2_42_14]OGZ98777.1 MAG: tryptophan--tRNA ligase [Candidatus Sungbacteria bacterium RIFCSPHIGHO2_02_FULL_41_12b]OHA12879.1 MAG: tryptophan--tRNA ligase [Candidatus Sungbacteria bacterium RIFCSPLOWO2_12_FULL_41_11]
MAVNKQTIFSGVAPSGTIHIGNYLGAIKNWVRLQDEYRSIFCIVDLHAITTPQDPEKLRKKIMEVAMIYLASGIDPEKSIIFIQSHVPAHTELGWILNTFTPLGELERMTQYKDKRQETSDKRHGVMAGLLNYPTLMAADILLYQTNKIPVGEDQLQHIELTRSLAERFNNRFGPTFTIPEALVDPVRSQSPKATADAPLAHRTSNGVEKSGARIMGLDDPIKKMSKSARNPENYIALLDSPDEIHKKIKIAVTDSGKEIIFDPKNKPAISNLLQIFGLFTDTATQELEKKYVGKNYAEFKKDLAEAVINGLKPIQEKYRELEKKPDAVIKILREGAESAQTISSKTIKAVKEKIGLIS